MAGQFELRGTPPFPISTPRTFDELVKAFEYLQHAIRDQHTEVASRVESMITVGPIASRPTADGTYRFYFADDEVPPVMYFDDGIWNAMNAT